MMSKISIILEFMEFVKHRKKWWLTPIFIFLLIFSLLIITTENSVLAPFIYALF